MVWNAAPAERACPNSSATAAPGSVTRCNCSICRRTGALWAYYAPRQVRFHPPEPPTDTDRWGDKTLDLHRCKTWGCVTHGSPIDRTYDRMGVNARLLDPALLASARVRRFDGADTWTFLDE